MDELLDDWPTLLALDSDTQMPATDDDAHKNKSNIPGVHTYIHVRSPRPLLLSATTSSLCLLSA